MDSSFFEQLGARGLAGEIAWLHGLAASLVRDPEEALDLAGDAWTEALERRPTPDASHSIRAWLTVVARRLAARKRREGGARRERERSVARVEAVPAADLAIERVELQRTLVEAVLSLDEPYRSAVVLRHLEQLSPAEIAQRQGCTNETARQRVARGLQQLRERLDREFDGGRDTWMALCIPFAAHAPLAGTAVLTGSALMSAKTIGALIACAAAALLIWFRPQLDLGQAASASAGGRVVAERVEAPGALLASIESPSSAWSRNPAQPVFNRPRLSGRVADSNGAAIPGVHVSFSSSIEIDGERFMGAPTTEIDAPDVESDADGRFQCFIDREPGADGIIEAQVRSGDFVEANQIIRPGEEALIVLAHLPRVEVRVQTPDGSVPTGGGSVQLLVRGKLNNSPRATRLDLDSDGVARSDPLPLGQLERVYAVFDGFAMQELSRSDELAGDTVVHIDVALTRGVALRGVVLDEATHRPVEGALVRAVPNNPRNLLASPFATTDNAGRFELRGVIPTQRALLITAGMSDLYRVTVEADDYLFPGERRVVFKLPSAEQPPVAVDGLELLLIPAGCGLVVTLQGPNARNGVAEFEVRAYDLQDHLFSPQLSGSGEFIFSELPATELRVIATKLDDPKSPAMALAELALARGEKRRIALEPESCDGLIQGRVVDARGRGVSAAYVNWNSFAGHSDRRSRIESGAVLSDATGCFQLQGLCPGVCEVSVQGRSGTELAFWPPRVKCQLDSGALVASVEFHAEPATSYAGTLEPLSAVDPDAPVLVQLAHAEYGIVSSLWVGEDGRFRFPGVFGAEYEVIAKRGDKILGRVAASRAGDRNLVVPLTR